MDSDQASDLADSKEPTNSGVEVKEEPPDEIKDYAEDTMNELLGLYGYGKLDHDEAERLKLQKYTESEKKKRAASDDDDDDDDEDDDDEDFDIEVDGSGDEDDDDMELHDDREDGDSDLDGPYVRKTRSPGSETSETSLASHYQTIASALSEGTKNSDKAGPSGKTPAQCAWCQKPGSKQYQLKTPSGNKTFCSEVCFTQCRRASFKRNKVCDWCKHVRHTVNYVDFQDGEQQLQFCSDKCLNQYKMNIFCKETQEHLQQIRVDPKGPPSGQNNQILITPELWMHPDSSSNDKPLDLQKSSDKMPSSPNSDSASEIDKSELEKTDRISIRIPPDDIKVSCADSSHEKVRSSHRKPSYPKQISVSPNSSSLSATPSSAGSLSPVVSRSADSMSLSPGRDSTGPTHAPPVSHSMMSMISPKHTPVNVKPPLSSRSTETRERGHSPSGTSPGQARPNSSRPVSAAAAPPAHPPPPHYQHPPGMMPPYHPLLPPHMMPLLPPPPPYIPGAAPLSSLTPPVTILVPIPLPVPIPIPIPIPVPVPPGFMKMFEKKEPATPEPKPSNVPSRSSSNSSTHTPPNSQEVKPKPEGHQGEPHHHEGQGQGHGHHEGQGHHRESQGHQGQGHREGRSHHRHERGKDTLTNNLNHLCKESVKENIKRERLSPDRDCIYCASCQSGQNHERVLCTANKRSPRPWSTPSLSGTAHLAPSPHANLMTSMSMDAELEDVAIDLSTDKSKNKHTALRKLTPPPLTSPHSNGSSDGALPLTPKINIAVAKHPPLASQVASPNNVPLVPESGNPNYSSRRGRILDSPNAPIGKKRSPSPETHRSRGLLDYKRRCLRTRIKTK